MNGLIVPIWYTCAQLPPSGKLRDTSTPMDKLTVTTTEPPTKRTKETLVEEENIDYSSEEGDSDSTKWEQLSEFSSSESDDASDW